MPVAAKIAAHRRQRVHDVHRSGPKPWHAGEARAGQHEIVDRRLVRPRPALAIGGDRAADEARIDTLQPRPIHEVLQWRAGCKVLNEDIRARYEPQELCCWPAILHLMSAR